MQQRGISVLQRHLPNPRVAVSSGPSPLSKAQAQLPDPWQAPFPPQGWAESDPGLEPPGCARGDEQNSLRRFSLTLVAAAQPLTLDHHRDD